MRIAFVIASSLVLHQSTLAAQTDESHHATTRASPHARALAPQRNVGVMDESETQLEGAVYYALIVGNNNYHLPIHALETPASDAKAVAKLLHDEYGFQTSVLLDATRSQIMDKLVSYRKTLSEDSKLIIYYAGHGYLDAAVDEAYWLPIDARPNNNDNWISADDITRAVRGIASRHVLVISDSCYSGAILGDEVSGRGLREMTGGLAMEYSAYLSKMESLTSKDWMASGSREPVADNGAPGHSVFAAALLQGLSEMKDTRFSASDLFYSFVKRKVGGSSQQLPQYGSIRMSGDQLGDFIFSRFGAAAIRANVAPPPITVPAITPEVITGPIAKEHTESATSNDDLIRINEALHQYELAYNTRNAAALWRVWPGAPVERRQPIEAYFRNAQSIRTTLQMSAPEIAPDHLTAVVRGRSRVSYTPRAGSSPPPAEGSITFSLRNDGGGSWTIVSVEFAP